MVVRIRLLSCPLALVRPCAAEKQGAPKLAAGGRRVMGHSSRRQASEGLCYEQFVRTPGLVVARQHYAAGTRTLAPVIVPAMADCTAAGKMLANVNCLPVWSMVAIDHLVLVEIRRRA